MFLLYINDLPAHVDQRSSCRLFAYDCLLYRPVESIEDQVQLQHDLRNLEQWASEWGMVFNPSKCYVMTVNRGRTHRPYLYELCGTILQLVDNKKYLRVMLTSDLSWSLHIYNITTKANQKLGFIKRNLKGSPQDLKKLAYIAFVRSGLEYACSVWDPHLVKNKDKLERVQRIIVGSSTSMVETLASPLYSTSCDWNPWKSAGGYVAWPSCTRSWTST